MEPAYLFRANPLWNAIFWLSYVLIFAMAMWVARRESKEAKGQSRDRGSRMVIYLFTFGGVALAFLGPVLFPFAKIGLFAPSAVFAAAIASIWFGMFLYVWAALTLGSFFRTSVQLVEGQRLVTRGPYRILRHPAYTGGVLIFSGVGLAMGNWVSFFAAALATFLGYIFRIHVEELALAERFGPEFEARKKRTWAIVPLVW